MKEIVSVISPPLQCKCLVCGRTSEPFQQTGEIEVEKYEIPFGSLDNIEWGNPKGQLYKKDGVNSISSICPDCQELGHTLEEFGRVAADWLEDKNNAS